MWDEQVCAESPAPEFEIPEDQTFLEQFLEMIGYQEIEIQTEDADGNPITIVVLGRYPGGVPAKVCFAEVCSTIVGCGSAYTCQSYTCGSVVSCGGSDCPEYEEWEGGDY